MKLFNKKDLSDWLLQHGEKSPFKTTDAEIALNELSPWIELGLDQVGYDIEVDANQDVKFKGKSAEVATSLDGFIKHGKLLNDLKEIVGFDSFKKSFRNPEQILDTLFEVRCLHFCYKHFNAVDFVISPKILKSGKEKYPEFMFKFNGNEFYCECKSLASVNRGKTSRALKLMESIRSDLKTLFGKYRMEVAFDSLPSHWNRNFGNQLFGAFGELIKRGRTDVHVKLNIAHAHKRTLMHIAIGPIGSNQLFKGLSVGDGVKALNSNIVITEFLNSKKDVKRAILDACTQLPDKKLSLIFINPLDKDGFLKASNEYLSKIDPNGPQVVSVIEERQGSYTFVTNLSLKAKISGLLKIK